MKEVLKLALEYMNECLEEHDAKYQRHPATEAERNNILTDIEIVKEALAQPEQGRLAKVEPCAVCGEGKARLSVLRSCDTCHSEYAGQAEMKVALGKPEQEPVAWAVSPRYEDSDGYFDFTDSKDTAEILQKRGWTITPLYTTPPKRPWVGLTATAKLDLLSTAKGVGGRINGDAQLLELLNEHETQLKRKNT